MDGNELTATMPDGSQIVWKNNAWVPVESAQQAPVQPNPLQNVPGSTTRRPTSAVVADSTTRTFLNNLMATPAALGSLASGALSGGAGLVETIAETPYFGASGFTDRLQQNIQGQTQQWPANALNNIPRPSVENVTSAAQALPAIAPGGESFQDAYSREMTQTQQAQELQRQQSPNATATGEVIGDVLTLAAGRQPFAKNLVNSSRSAPTITNKATREALEAVAKEQPELLPEVTRLIGSGQLSSPGAQRLYNRIIESGPVSSVMRGLGKAAEASLEGAVLAAIKENDPVLNAGLAGGGQIATSALSSILGVPSSLKDLAWKAAGYFVFFRTAQEFGLGENSVYAAGDTSFNKLATGITIGLTSQIIGGRFRGSGSMGQKLAEDLPRFTDALNSVPRGVLNSLLNQAQSNESSSSRLIAPTLEKLSTNPSVFPEAIRNRLSRSLDSGNFAQELERLSNNVDFTNALEGRSQ